MNQKIEPCLYCNHPLTIGDDDSGLRWWECTNPDCEFEQCLQAYVGDEQQILIHNNLCRLVRLGKAAEKLLEKPPELETEEPPYPLPTEPRDANHHSAGFYWSRQIILNRLKAALEEEMNQKIAPCPYCEKKCVAYQPINYPDGFIYAWVKCTDEKCAYNSGCYEGGDCRIQALQAHNNLCRLVNLGKTALHARNACAAFARVLERHGLLGEAVAEATAAGVPDGFGKELDDALKAALEAADE